MKIKRVKELKELRSTKFLSLYEMKYENKLGNYKTWMLASRKSKQTLEDIYFNDVEDSPDAVVIAAIHEESKKLVIIREYRIPVNDYVYSLPAGLIDFGEDAYTSAKRELKEETGLKISSFNEDISKNKVYLSPGMTDESSSFLYCRCTGKISKEFLEENEDIEPLLISKDEALEMIKSEYKFDVKAFLVLQMFAMGYIE